MTAVLWMLLIQGSLGTFDTLYYHELHAQLPGRPEARTELLLHAVRDFIYTILFASIPWIAWHGVWSAVLFVLLLAEILITLTDFVVEDTTRAPMGGIAPLERTMHTVMAILYGAVLAYLLPEMWAWWKQPTALVFAPVDVPLPVGVTLGLMSVGVGVSGLRDLLAALGVSAARWPYAPAGAR